MAASVVTMVHKLEDDHDNNNDYTATRQEQIMSPEKIPLTQDNTVSFTLNQQLQSNKSESPDPYQLVLPTITGGKVPLIDMDAEMLSAGNRVG